MKDLDENQLINAVFRQANKLLKRLLMYIMFCFSLVVLAAYVIY